MQSNIPLYRGMLEQLISFPSVSRETNLPLIDYTEKLLGSYGFWTQRFYNDRGDKANLIARLGPEKAGGLMLAGHTDVVPVDDQDWVFEPFQLTEKNGYLHGRGTSDMKGFLALALDVAAGMRGHDLQCPLYICFTYDEEIGCGGAKALVDFLKNLPTRPRLVLIGEPTEMTLVTAHKGIQIIRTHIRGKPAHSSCPHLGASAIVFAAKFIAAIEKVLPTEEDPEFNPPSSTFNIGLINGGTAVNIIPEYCQFVWECRTLPSHGGTQMHSALDHLTHTLQNQMPGIKVENYWDGAVPGLKSGENLEMAAWLKGFLRNGKIGTAPFVTEAGLYQEAGIPAVVCGPGSIEQAHQPDENIAIEKMEDYRIFLHKVVEEMLF